jgi:hypothetical protein
MQMILEDLMLDDDFQDDVYPLLQQLRNSTSWNKKTHETKESLRSLLKSKGYVSIVTSNPNRYHVNSIGSSYLYDVPLDKRGHLERFRGKRVRIVCTGSGKHTWREVMAGLVYDSPADKIVVKRERKYQFPDYVDAFHCCYRSPRYRIIDIPPDSSMTFLSWKNEVIDLTGYSSLLIDGTLNAPIAAVRFNENKTIGLKVAGHAIGRDHESLREAIDWANYCVH